MNGPKELLGMYIICSERIIKQNKKPLLHTLSPVKIQFLKERIADNTITTYICCTVLQKCICETKNVFTAPCLLINS